MLNNTVYLDNCCFNRPYDDQSQPLIKLETEAKIIIQQEIINGNLDLVWSFILYYENYDNPYDDRKNQIALWESIAKKIVVYNNNILTRAKHIMELNISAKDALHISCALYADAGFFITTDKKLLLKIINGIIITDPINFLRRYYNDD